MHLKQFSAAKNGTLKNGARGTIFLAPAQRGRQMSGVFVQLIERSTDE